MKAGGRVLQLPPISKASPSPKAEPARDPLCSLLEALTERIADAVDARIAERLDAIGSKPGPRLLDRRALAEVLGCGIDTIDRMRREGMPELTVGDAPRFDAEEVLTWLRARRGAE